MRKHIRRWNVLGAFVCVGLISCRALSPKNGNLAESLCPAPSEAAFLSVDAPKYASVGVCSGPFTIRSGLGAPLQGDENLLQSTNCPHSFRAREVASEIEVVLNTAHGEFFDDAKCGTSIGRTKIGLGDSHSEKFYYRAQSIAAFDNNSTQEVLFTFWDQPKAFVPANHILVLSDRSVSQLKIHGPKNVKLGVCAPFELTQLDLAGNNANATREITVNLDIVGAAGRHFFYSDPKCTAHRSQVTLAAGTNATKFYFKDAAHVQNRVHLMSFIEGGGPDIRPAKHTIYILGK